MELDFISNKDSLLHLEYYFWSMVKGVNMSEDQKHKVRICFHEAVTNAATHGNGLDGSKHIFIRRVVEGSKLIFKITDEGKGFDYSKIQNPLLAENLNTPNGRGLLLVNEMACQSAYCNQTKTMKLEFNF